jgi:transposase
LGWWQVPIIDPMTGEVHEAHLFVAALGASSYTYAEARWSETLPDWIGAHVNALDFLGGLPKAAVPDNLKAGITKPSRYEPGVNRTYQDLADHYGFVVRLGAMRRKRLPSVILPTMAVKSLPIPTPFRVQ